MHIDIHIMWCFHSCKSICIFWIISFVYFEIYYSWNTFLQNYQLFFVHLKFFDKIVKANTQACTTTIEAICVTSKYIMYPQDGG